MDTLVRTRMLVLFFFAALAVCVWLLPSALAPHDSQLRVSFFDVGQGDAIFIETPNGVQVLIDGGRDRTVLARLHETMGFFDRKIDMVVGTHPDMDHIGGLVDVLQQYEVATILTTENKGESSTAETYHSLQTTEGAKIVYARRGQTFALDASTTLRVLFPETNPEALESNASSIMLQLTYGDTSFIFTGDAPKSIEEYVVLVEGEALQSDVLKVGHHGSRTSTSELFLDEVQPTYAVISAGEGNSYGHPHVEVTDLLFNTRVEVLETAKEGTITFRTDGKNLTRKE